MHSENCLREITILLVEDDNEIADLVVYLVEQEGGSIVHVRNGNEALWALDKAVFDVIILDLDMPVMDGVAFLGARESQANLAQIPVIVASGSARIAEVKSYNKVTLLAKPYSMFELVSRVCTLTYSDRRAEDRGRCSS